MQDLIELYEMVYLTMLPHILAAKGVKVDSDSQGQARVGHVRASYGGLQEGICRHALVLRSQLRDRGVASDRERSTQNL